MPIWIVVEAGGAVVKLKVCTVQATVTLKLLIKGGTPG